MNVWKAFTALTAMACLSVLVGLLTESAKYAMLTAAALAICLFALLILLTTAAVTGFDEHINFVICGWRGDIRKRLRRLPGSWGKGA